MTEPIFVEPPKVTPSQVMDHARRAMEAACTYFRISSDWEITLKPSAFEDSTEAQITHSGHYMTALIEIDLPHFQKSPERIWPKVAHEVAHLVTAEISYLWHQLPDEVKESRDYQKAQALERATVRLERMFARDCPDPGVS